MSINTTVNFIAIILLVIYLFSGFGVVSLPLGFLTRAVLNLLGQGTWIIIKWTKMNLPRPTFNFIVIINLLKDCFYPFLTKISNVLMGNSQSFIIAIFINPALAAIYDITSKICAYSSTFISMMNGSFFALFSLTFATKDKSVINKTVNNITSLYMMLLSTVLLYSFCFSKLFINFWVGPDKYGGNLLLILIVSSYLFSIIKAYLNSLLFSGGLINKSSIFDISSMVVYVIVLLSIIKFTNEYAIPIATIVSVIIFIPMYFTLLNRKLSVNINQILKIIIKSLLLIIPFIILSIIIAIIKIDLSNVWMAIAYLCSFTLVYLSWLFIWNKNMILKLLSMTRYGKKYSIINSGCIYR